MACKIEFIFTTPEASGEMQSQSYAALIAGVGLQGDRYANGVGTYSVLKGSLVKGPHVSEPGRQVTLISADEVDQAMTRCNLQLKNYGSLRRNIVVRGLSVRTLDLIGKAIRMGNDGAILFVHRHCVPCMYNERKNGIPGLRQAIWDEAGINCEVIKGGTIRVGDTVHILTAEEYKSATGGELPLVDPGTKGSGFFLHPKQQTAAMVRESLEQRKKDFLQYSVSDPEGSARAERSFASVGLSFWPPSCTNPQT